MGWDGLEWVGMGWGQRWGFVGKGGGAGRFGGGFGSGWLFGFEEWVERVEMSVDNKKKKKIKN